MTSCCQTGYNRRSCRVARPVKCLKCGIAIVIARKRFSCVSSQSNTTTQCLYDYIISHASGDRKHYLEVSISDCYMLSLLESGATDTMISESGCVLLRRVRTSVE